MQNPEFFVDWKAMTHEEFMAAWRDEDAKSGHVDPFMPVRHEQLDTYARDHKLDYYLVTLSESGWQNVVHKEANPAPDRIENIRTFLSKSLEEYKKLSASTFTLGHLCRPRQLTVIDNPDYYPPGYGNEKLYSVNQTRLHVFEKWIVENGFQPVKAYLCEDPARLGLTT